MEVEGETYEVIYNTCYGGPSYPREFLEAVFERFPPETPLGKKLWQGQPTDVLNEGEEPNTEWHSFYRLLETKPFNHGYHWLRVQHFLKNKEGVFEPLGKGDKFSKYFSKDNKILFYLAENWYRDEWRSASEIVKMVKEHDLIGKKQGHALLKIAKVPKGYGFEVTECDGMESVRFHFPFREVISDLLQLHKGVEQELNPLTKKLLSGELSVNKIQS